MLSGAEPRLRLVLASVACINLCLTLFHDTVAPGRDGTWSASIRLLACICAMALVRVVGETRQVVRQAVDKSATRPPCSSGHMRVSHPHGNFPPEHDKDRHQLFHLSFRSLSTTAGRVARMKTSTHWCPSGAQVPRWARRRQFCHFISLVAPEACINKVKTL